MVVVDSTGGSGALAGALAGAGVDSGLVNRWDGTGFGSSSARSPAEPPLLPPPLSLRPRPGRSHCNSQQHNACCCWGSRVLFFHSQARLVVDISPDSDESSSSSSCYQLDTLAALGAAAVHSRCNSHQQTMGSGRKQV